MARTWAALGNQQRAMHIVDAMWKNSMQYLRWYCSLDGYRFDAAAQDCLMHFYILQQLERLTETVDSDKADRQIREMNAISNLFEQKGGNIGY